MTGAVLHQLRGRASGAGLSLGRRRPHACAPDPLPPFPTRLCLSSFAGSAITGPVAKECADLWPRVAAAANTIV